MRVRSKESIDMLGRVYKLLSSQGALLAAAGLVVASSVVAGSGSLAAFQAQTSNPGNVFASGILRMTNVAGSVISGTDCAAGATRGVVGSSNSCATLFNSAALHVVGDTSANTVTITNTGTVAGLLSLGIGSVTTGQGDSTAGAPACDSTAQATYKGQITLELLDGATSLGSAALSGTLPSLSSVSVAAGGSKTYTVKLAFGSTGTTAGDNAIQNCTVAFAATWTLDQRAATTSTNGTAA
jgi:hypothetical protein